jgi:hypothetical protein
MSTDRLSSLTLAAFKERFVPDESIRMIANAIFSLAMNDLDSPENEIKDSAVKWVNDDTRDGIFCFVSVCDLLGLEPGWVRRMIEKNQINVVRMSEYRK